MALSMMLPGMVAGYLQEQVGYEWFFWIVMLCCVPRWVMTFLVRQSIDADYGRKQQH
jgi:PAT family beta-lactamase induction signal transducer AmpG